MPLGYVPLNARYINVCTVNLQNPSPRSINRSTGHKYMFGVIVVIYTYRSQTSSIRIVDRHLCCGQVDTELR